MKLCLFFEQVVEALFDISKGPESPLIEYLSKRT